MTYTTYTKQFINEFNFAEPRWDKVPRDIRNLPTYGLTKQEKHLFEAIRLAYFTLENGRNEIIRSVTKTSLVVVTICFISLIGLITLISLSPDNNLTKPVNAATVSAQIRSGGFKASQIIESTMSAIFK